MDSDENFTICRRFGFIHSRLLLYKQDQLREMEEDLRNIDQRDSNDEDTKNCLGQRDVDDARPKIGNRQTRKELLEALEKKVLEYGKQSSFQHQGSIGWYGFHRSVPLTERVFDRSVGDPIPELYSYEPADE